MTVLEEGDLRLEIPEGKSGRKFDGSQHGLSHCMAAVDWIVDLGDRIWFIEVKDPDDPDAMAYSKREKFLQSLSTDKYTRQLVTKFRDSFLYEWACERIDSPVDYFVIIASRSLEAAQLLPYTDQLKRTLPVNTPVSWTRSIADRCIVFNIDTWNRQFTDYRLYRASESDR